MKLPGRNPLPEGPVSARRRQLGNVSLALLAGVIGTLSAQATGAALRSALNSSAQNSSVPADVQLKELQMIIARQYLYPADQARLADGALFGAVQEARLAARDPYSRYLTAAEARNEDRQVTGQVQPARLGLRLGDAPAAQAQAGATVVTQVLPGAAGRAGLNAGDLLLSVNGADVHTLAPAAAQAALTAASGETLTLNVRRAGRNVTLNITPVAAALIRQSRQQPGQLTGLLVVRSFFEDDVRKKLSEAVARLKSSGVTRVIIDLRGNGGGYLDAGEHLAELFLKGGRIDSTEGQNGRQTVVNAAQSGADLLVPVTVLIDAGTASASEVAAAALQESGHALLVGQLSRGKGRAQSAYNLLGGGRLVLTTDRWRTPSGRDVQQQGLKPDRAVSDTRSGHAAKLPGLETLIGQVDAQVDDAQLQSALKEN